MAPKGWKTRPLSVRVRAGILSIEIGIDTLAHSALCSDYAFGLMGPNQERPDTRFRIDDKVAFAREVGRELEDELGEDGSTLVTYMFDDAFVRAFENGSEAVVDLMEPAE